MTLEPMFRRALGRGLWTTVVATVILFLTADKFDLEPLAALTIGVAVMGYDWVDFQIERRRRRDGRARPAAVLCAMAGAALAAGLALRLGYSPDVDRARWTRDGVTHELETRLWPWDEHADHHQRAVEALLGRKL